MLLLGSCRHSREGGSPEVSRSEGRWTPGQARSDDVRYRIGILSWQPQGSVLGGDNLLDPLARQSQQIQQRFLTERRPLCRTLDFHQ